MSCYKLPNLFKTERVNILIKTELMKILHARFLSSTVEGVDEIFENIETDSFDTVQVLLILQLGDTLRHLLTPCDIF